MVRKHDFTPLKLIQSCFMIQQVISLGECSVYICKELYFIYLFGIVVYKCQHRLGCFLFFFPIFYILTLCVCVSVDVCSPNDREEC